MTEETLHKEGRSLIRAFPMYLAAQAAILLFTSLDSPVYLEVYRSNHFFTVNGWVGAWFILVLFGITTSIFLLIRKSWRHLFADDSARAKLALGYFLGGLIGMFTLGVRFLPLVPPQYFMLVGGFTLISTGAYLVWKKRVHRVGELFP